ncbi:hypothetical protein ARMGADRAFT_216623 [Armillaria gallica]|uniref:Uncharacterized protein n=1 Tax=Armillaria gallica TaxID=47427 RepID=A0A2H3DTY1_ARMGA|nr:hypothetical protein ARMGADRAFT_216623 [Armillaria gallica]
MSTASLQLMCLRFQVAKRGVLGIGSAAYLMDLCHWSVTYERIRSPLFAGATLAQEYMFFLDISRRVPGLSTQTLLTAPSKNALFRSSENVTLQAAYSIEISVPPRYGEHRYILSERSQNVVMCDLLCTTESIDEVAFTIRGKTSTVGRRTKSA